MAIIKPESGCADQDGPVARVLSNTGCRKKHRGHDGLEREAGELHCGLLTRQKQWKSKIEDDLMNISSMLMLATAVASMP
jgi:hypothetical protein